jgi:hypothetical protein
MNKTPALLLSLVIMSGCASNYRISTMEEVYNTPVDCLNRTMIVNWLNEQTTYLKPITQTEDEYNKRISAIKQKLWTVRARCNAV